jgi:hypothetical protein
MADNVKALRRRKRPFVGRLVPVAEEHSRSFLPPHDWSCSAIEAAGRISLPEKAREFLWKSIGAYELAIMTAGVRLSPAARRKKIGAAADKARGLADSMQNLLSEILSHKDGNLVDLLDDMLPVVRRLESALAAEHENKPKGGHPAYPGLGAFIRRLATIYSCLGKKVSAAQSIDGRQTPFVRFCEAAYSEVILPANIARPIAIADCVRHELRRNATDLYMGDALVQRIANQLSG